MNTEKKPLSWTPVRRGSRYCSPACGLGCTHAAFVRAQGRARALAKRLGKGWKPHVWENLGWHYSAVKGVCSVHPHGRDSGADGYTVFLNVDPQIVLTHDDPREAVDAAIMHAHRNINHSRLRLAEVES